MFENIKDDAKYHLYEMYRHCPDGECTPLQAVRYDRIGGRSGKISKPTEHWLTGFKKETLERIDKENREKHRWQALVKRLEETLSERQRMILTVWREPKKKGQTRESICYEKYGTTCAHRTMSDVMELLVERLAGMYFAMKIN